MRATNTSPPARVTKHPATTADFPHGGKAGAPLHLLKGSAPATVHTHRGGPKGPEHKYLIKNYGGSINSGHGITRLPRVPAKVITNG